MYTQRAGKYDELSAAAKAADVQRLVLLSSIAAAESRHSEMGAYHKRAEDIIRASAVYSTYGSASSIATFVSSSTRSWPMAVESSNCPTPVRGIEPVAEEDLAAVALTALITDALLDEAPC